MFGLSVISAVALGRLRDKAAELAVENVRLKEEAAKLRAEVEFYRALSFQLSGKCDRLQAAAYLSAKSKMKRKK